MAEPSAGTIQAEVESIVQSGVLGKSDAYPRLLRYLVEHSTGRPVKEIEIAIEVFGRDETFDVTQDSLVRVYIHKLRSRLDDYYSGPGKDAAKRLSIPKGSYRVELTKTETAEPTSFFRLGRGPGKWMLLGILVGLFFAVAGAQLADRVRLANQAISHPLWAPLLQEGRPVLLVVGEYFIYSELNEEFEQLREVRDFSIHSSEQFEQALQNQSQPTLVARDFGVRYVPAGSAPALANLVEMLQPRLSWQVVSMEQVARRDTSGYNLIYLGPFTGLGELKSAVFGGSDFTLHPNGMVLIDQSEGEVFANEGQLTDGLRDRYVDYALFVRRHQPDGQWIYAILSPRDAGLRLSTDMIAGPDSQTGLVDSLAEIAEQTENLEMLIEVSGTAADDLQSQVRLIREIRVE